MFFFPANHDQGSMGMWKTTVGEGGGEIWTPTPIRRGSPDHQPPPLFPHRTLVMMSFGTCGQVFVSSVKL